MNKKNKSAKNNDYNPDNFGLHYDYEYPSYADADVVFLMVPFEGSVTYGSGTAKGPQAIIDASHHMEWFDADCGNIYSKIKIHTWKKSISEKTAKKTIEKVYEQTKKFADDGKFIILLGGEHSITPGAVRALKERMDKEGKKLSVLQIDAHADLRDTFEEGVKDAENQKYNHACAMKRVLDLGVPVVHVGIRSYGEDEYAMVEKQKKNIFFANRIYADKNDSWIDEAVSRLSDNVFITIDVDGFDPAIMPSTGTPEPGGLDWYKVIKLLKAVSEKKKIVGFDVVELAPIKGLHGPDFMCAKLIYKLIGYSFAKELKERKQRW